MNTSTLKKFSQSARRQLREQVRGRLEQVLLTDSAELRGKDATIRELRQEIAHSSKESVVDRVAYTWFNRFCALRFMDVNHYTRAGVVSPAEGFTQPEILQEAKSGYIDESLRKYVNSQSVLGLLSGQLASSDPQQEAYRALLVGVCNAYNEEMPFLFEKIADYTELLMPLDLLSENSVLHDLREAMTPEACQDVEVIGWLYQYYISERKDEVFAALKQNQKIEAEDIPAATQLFTPHWIVRYLVENSLGRLWLLNHPDAKLAEKMEYYIKPVEEETEYLKVSSPEELKICDPACGSGHMLTYAFDLLHAIYEEQGYPVAEIPHLILQKNLYGVEIDQRAGALAAFALFMKARGKDKRFFSRPTQPNVCVLENVAFTDQELEEYMAAVGRDLFTTPLLETLKQFDQADNFGSLIRPILTDAAFVRQTLVSREVGGNIFLFDIHRRVLKVLEYAEYLAPQYHVVVANPPYMGGRNMFAIIREYLKQNYSIASADLFSALIVRNFELALKEGYLGFVTPFVWMFLSSYEVLRNLLISQKTIISLVKPSYTSFFASAIVPLVTFVMKNNKENIIGQYFDLGYLGSAESQPQIFLEAKNTNASDMTYAVLAEEFTNIPGSPIAYSASKKIRTLFKNESKLGDIADAKVGLATGDNNRFIRYWYEVAHDKIGFNYSTKADAKSSAKKWFPYNKGGSFRKWFGNNDFVVNWENDGEAIINFKPKSVIRNPNYYFRESITWSFVSSSYFGVRYSKGGAIFDVAGSSIFPDEKDFDWLIGFLNSRISSDFIKLLNPTMNIQAGNISSLPIIKPKNNDFNSSQELIKIAKADWDFFETSWDFNNMKIFYGLETITLQNAYELMRTSWKKITLETKRLEEENNLLFLETYGLKDELSLKVPLEEITLTCNPYYRYNGNPNEVELESLLKTDTMKEFISYSVGCMFGRYSLDKPGLVLANQGETLGDYLKQIPEPTFLPDEDNAIPVLEGEWFEDDMVERFKKFLRVTFGDEHYDENLAFIEEAIGRDIRSYFLREFYDYHIRMYKKRPIYWMFSSPKGNFNVLIYMHRYQPDTVSVILNNYLRPFKEKLSAQKAFHESITLSAGSSQAEKAKSEKAILELNKMLAELKAYEDEILYPLATQKIAIDLDDGVKANYPKYGKALREIKGL